MFNRAPVAESFNHRTLTRSQKIRRRQLGNQLLDLLDETLSVPAIRRMRAARTALWLLAVIAYASGWQFGALLFVVAAHAVEPIITRLTVLDVLKKWESE